MSEGDQAKDSEQLKDKREREKRVVGLMIRLYCNGNHETQGKNICSDCKELLAYTIARTDRCPHMETKTFCSNCTTSCYNPLMKEKIREVMRWSGPRMIFHHPVLALRHVIESKREQKSCV